MPKVLYIEDNFDNRLLVRRILMASRHKFEIIEADNALTGIELAQQHLPDVILMDVSMPGLDGLTATQRLRAIESVRHIPIIALTANAMDGDKERTLAAGCDGYIAKPVDVDKLPDEVFSYIRSRDERGAESKTLHVD